ncbi:MATE family efflux transporter [Clostridium sp. Marseille-P2415]|uniref:MATE family efflux transporter n=1 Tax=Clostridium sp. Marseille-P2415 TaxID=1805471 RepID=UPI0009884955|nr:MATE family efflux transporter [Clostridium sp. Marseille-P2415]
MKPKMREGNLSCPGSDAQEIRTRQGLPDLFSNRQLRQLIFPLVIEQILAVFMGMADTIMVASCGEAAVSGISIVDTISVLLIGLFGAMAAGGSVVAAQYIGRKDERNVARASGQLFLAVGGLSLGLMAVTLLFNQPLLRLIYGAIDQEVMSNARIYFYLSSLSYPFLAFYNSAAALFRAVGNSRVSMQISLVANLINIAGNALLIYVFQMGVAGAGLSTLFSRILSAVIILVLLRRKSHLPVEFRLRMDKSMLRQILYIGVPNGLENSIFQLGKLLLSSLTASFGTVAIAANAVASTICGLETIPANAIGIAMITVVGQCIGARELGQARRYMGKLLKTAYLWLLVLNLAIIPLLNPICGLFHLSGETSSLAVKLMLYHSICCMIIHPLSFCLTNGLRAANDVRFTMTVSICSMWICRIVLAYILSLYFGLGLMGIWIAMTIDWLVRAIFFSTRVLSGKWCRYANRNIS